MRLAIVPVTFRQAGAFITAHRRFHPPPIGMKPTLGVAADGGLVGVVTVGRPLRRHLDDGFAVEVTRTCTQQVPNANAMLYVAAWRVAKAMGYQRVTTHTQHGEAGVTLAPLAGHVGCGVSDLGLTPCAGSQT